MLTSIPSPSQGVWHLGPLPLRAYAILIIIGIIAAAWIAGRRFVTRTEGGTVDDVYEITFWAVPFGIIGGRLYHVITTPEPYWGAGGNPISALYIWQGGLGIWGAIALGALGAWIGCRRRNIRFASFVDAVAPGLLVAQAIGRLGNWFNQELFGAPTTLPWGLEISPGVIADLNRATGSAFEPGTLFHPTFLYELLWNLAMAGLLVYIDRKFRLGHGRVMWLYVSLYTLGRVWIEMLRVDTAERISVFGMDVRLNVYTAIIMFILSMLAFAVIGKRHPVREDDARLVIPDDEEDEAVEPVETPEPDDDEEDEAVEPVETPEPDDDTAAKE